MNENLYDWDDAIKILEQRKEDIKAGLICTCGHHKHSHVEGICGELTQEPCDCPDCDSAHTESCNCRSFVQWDGNVYSLLPKTPWRRRK